MKLTDNVYVLELPSGTPGNPFNVTLLLGGAEGATLVDTGIPGQQEAIAAAMAEAGVGLNDLTAIIITHQDIDHIGSLHDLVVATGARVIAGSVERPTIDGTTLPRFARPEILEQRPQLRPLAERFQPSQVDETVEDGGRIERAGGIEVIFTPGHTPGHLCLYHAPSRTLIAGDALTAEAGRLTGPNPGATENMLLAGQSIRKLTQLAVDAIVCYHGGVVRDDAQGQLTRVADDLAASEVEAGGA